MIISIFFIIISNVYALNIDNFIPKSVNLNNIAVNYETYDSHKFKVYKPYTVENNEELPNIVFYTGGSSYIPSFIYTNFLKTLASYNYKVYAADSKSEKNECLYDNLSDNTYILGHSSGCITALNDSNNNKYIKTAILLDPVKSNEFRIFNKKDLKIKYLKNILLLNAKQSYNWKLFPKIRIPFIPAFSLSEKDLKKINNKISVEKIEAINFGHCDILDTIYSDFMHKTLSEGNYNRDELFLLKYINWLALSIDCYIKENYIKNETTLAINMLEE
tara:strand:- start:1006 stop:1830 length:825 start_codon:yes stop_codon:yes gene_type:complete